MELAPNLHRIGTGPVNCYVVEDGDSVTVIDAGMPGQLGELEAELRSMGRSLDDVKAIVLTHGDTDHVGFAERLRRDRGVPIFVHELDAARARAEVRKPISGWGPIRLRAFGGFMLYAATHGGLRIPKIAQVLTFGDTATLDVPGSPQVTHLPGHTPGSVALHFPAVRALFVGDAIATLNVLTGALGPSLAPFTLDRAGALSSLDRLDSIEADWMLPGHGQPWRGGVADALRRVRADTSSKV